MANVSRQFKAVGSDGKTRIVRIASSITIDDVMLSGMKAVAAERALNIPYSSPHTASTRAYLLHARVIPDRS